ncbi:hypothetical protein QOT17_015351 [Balamuthia mandrillaris]
MEEVRGERVNDKGVIDGMEGEVEVKKEEEELAIGVGETVFGQDKENIEDEKQQPTTVLTTPNERETLEEIKAADATTLTNDPNRKPALLKPVSIALQRLRKRLPQGGPPTLPTQLQNQHSPLFPSSICSQAPSSSPSLSFVPSEHAPSLLGDVPNTANQIQDKTAGDSIVVQHKRGDGRATESTVVEQPKRSSSWVHVLPSHPSFEFCSLNFAKVQNELLALSKENQELKDKLRTKKETTKELKSKLHSRRKNKGEKGADDASSPLTLELKAQRKREKRLLLEEQQRKIMEAKEEIRMLQQLVRQEKDAKFQLEEELQEAQIRASSRSEYIEFLKSSQLAMEERLEQAETRLKEATTKLITNEALVEKFEQNFAQVEKQLNEARLVYECEQKSGLLPCCFLSFVVLTSYLFFRYSPVAHLKDTHAKMLHTYQTSQGKVKVMRKALKGWKGEERRLRSRVLLLEAELKDAQSLHTIKDKELESRQAAFEYLQNTNKRIQSEKELLLTRYEESQGLLRKAMEAISNQEHKIEELRKREEEHQKLQQELHEIKVESIKLKTELVESKQTYELKLISFQREANSTKDDLEAENTSLQSSIRKYRESLIEVETELETEKQQTKRLRGQLTALEALKQQLRARVKELEEEKFKPTQVTLSCPSSSSSISSSFSQLSITSTTPMPSLDRSERESRQEQMSMTAKTMTVNSILTPSISTVPSITFTRKESNSLLPWRNDTSPSSSFSSSSSSDEKPQDEHQQHQKRKNSDNSDEFVKRKRTNVLVFDIVDAEEGAVDVATTNKADRCSKDTVIDLHANDEEAEKQKDDMSTEQHIRQERERKLFKWKQEQRKRQEQLLSAKQYSAYERRRQDEQRREKQKQTEEEAVLGEGFYGRKKR